MSLLLPLPLFRDDVELDGITEGVTGTHVFN